MPDLHDLPSAVRGRVLLPGDAGFEAASLPWDRAVTQPVAAVVEVEDADDVAALARYAAGRGVPIAAQPSGHGASGNAQDVILMRTRRLNELTVDPTARTARAGAGVRWGEVLAATGPHNLIGLAGGSPVVSVTGYTLGGGLSWFARAHGWAADSVTAFDVVTAQGAQTRVTATSDPDLFWALRGGGGDYALVTAVEFTLHPAPTLYGGRMVWPGAKAQEALDAFRHITANAPRELSVWLNLASIPGMGPLVAVDSTYLGDPARAADLLAPLARIDGVVQDTRAVLPIANLGAITAEPTDPMPTGGRAELLTTLDDHTAKTLVSTPVEPLAAIQLRHLGGALAAGSDSPHGPLTEPYYLFMTGAQPTQDQAQAITAKTTDLVTSLGTAISGRKPFTTLRPGETPAAVFTPHTLTRLQAIKRDRDPNNLIRSNYPVNG